MASYPELERRLQAYIDDELSASERILVEKKVQEHAWARKMLDRQRASAAEMYETLREHRLEHDMTPYVMDHLPEMEAQRKDMRFLNRRAKNPKPFRNRFVQFTPVYALIVIVVMAYVLSQNWPEKALPVGAIGMVTHSAGSVERIEALTYQQAVAPLETPCLEDDVFVTGEDGELVLTLMESSRIRLAPDSRCRVMGDRTVQLEKGRMLMDVTSGNRLFRVLTEHGTVTVYGTTFEVDVDPAGTTVVVAEGEVTLTHLSNPGIFANLGANEIGRLNPEDGAIETDSLDAWQHVAWSDPLQPNWSVETRFLEQFGVDESETVISGRRDYFAITGDAKGNPARIRAVRLSWLPGAVQARYCSYDVLVKVDGERPLFQTRIPAEVFADPDRNSITLRNTGDTGMRCRFITLDVYPNYEDGTEEVLFRKEFEVILDQSEESAF